MAVIITDVDMQKACCAYENEEVKHCYFYNVCRHRDTVKVNYKPSDCPLQPVSEKEEDNT